MPATGAEATMEILGKSSATMGMHGIFRFGGKKEYVLVEEPDEELEAALKLPEELTSESALDALK
jgi:hypothetical protein